MLVIDGNTRWSADRIHRHYFGVQRHNRIEVDELEVLEFPTVLIEEFHSVKVNVICAVLAGIRLYGKASALAVALAVGDKFAVLRIELVYEIGI